MPIFRKHDDSPRERSEEERERARAERAARRAARAGTAPPPDLSARFAGDAAVPVDEPPRRAEEPREVVAEPPEAVEEPREEPPHWREFVEEPGTVPAERHDVVEEPHEVVAERPEVVEEPHELVEEPHGVAARHEVVEEPHDVVEQPRGVAAEPRDLVGEPSIYDDEPLEVEQPRTAPPEEFLDDPASVEPPAADAHAQPPAYEEPLQPTAPFDPLGAGTGEHDVAPGLDEEMRAEVTVPAPAEDAPSTTARPPIVPPAARRARTGRTIPPPPKIAGGDDERPVAPKRISAAERRLPPTPPPPGTPAFSKRRRRRGRILAAIALLLLAAFLFGLNSLFQPFKGDGGETVTVRIPPNSTIADVGDLLAESEIVDSSLLFTVRARLAGADLKAGTYQLKKDSSYGDALDALGEDPAAPRTIKVVIPEGRSRSETAPIVKEAGLAGSYAAETDSQKGFSPRKYGAPRNGKTLEGFLFPATYELRPGADAGQLVDQQLAAFGENIREVDMKRARRRNLTVYDVLIIASMVEREATLAKERPIIAAVIHNRLRQGMPLGIDATIRYAVKNWTEPLKVSELNIDSPYNTRKRTGLPPTPIGSPGLDSIKAAANPADVDFLFYVVKPNGDGAHNFSSTDAEFQRDVDAYNQERERRGGQSPADSG